MRPYALTLLVVLPTLGGLGALAATPEHLILGNTSTGETVTFNRAANGWGIGIEGPGAPLLSQAEPARLEISDAPAGNMHQLNAAYEHVSRTPNGVEASVVIHSSTVVSFRIRDIWQLQENVLSVQRTVTVQGADEGGFSSSILFSAPKLSWEDASYFAPGVLYADTTYDGERSPGGTALYAAHHFSFREDILPSPLLGLYFRSGASVAMLDPMPRGDTTETESPPERPATTPSLCLY